MQEQSQYSPQDYALAFHNGEQAGFAWFFRLLYPSLTLYAAKMIRDHAAAEEIASSAFIRIWQRHHQFHAPQEIKSYLYKIVRNDAIKFLNRAAKQSMVFDMSGIHLADPQINPFQNLVAAETSRQLMSALTLLPPQCEKVLRLLYVEGKSVKETALELNLSISTIRTQQKRGINTLRQKLKFILPLFLSLVTL